MLIVQDCIISEDIAEKHFCCDLAQCKGECCIEGDCGAPLEENEIPIMERVLPEVEPYMTPEGIEVVHQVGVSVPDHAGEPSTPLINNRECAFINWGDDGLALCAIERAFRDGKIDWMKPVSCHLYPIRVDVFGEFTAVNYHRWDICKCAFDKGEPLYKMLKEPLIRRFGQEWYDELVQQIDERYNN